MQVGLVGRLLGAALVVVGCGGGSATPSPIGASVSEAGRAALHFSVNAATLASEGSLAATVELVNIGPEAVVWRSNACLLEGMIRITPSEPPVVDDPAARLGELEAAFVRGLAAAAEHPAGASTVEPLGARRAADCRLDHGFSVLGPGVRVAGHATWSAVTAPGAPVLAGSYRLTATAFILRAGAGLIPADFVADRDAIALEAVIEVLVVEAQRPRAPAAAAIARLVRGTVLGDWIQASELRLEATTIRYDDREWVVTVTRSDGVTGIGRIADDAVRGPTLEIVP